MFGSFQASQPPEELPKPARAPKHPGGSMTSFNYARFTSIMILNHAKTYYSRICMSRVSTEEESLRWTEALQPLP